MFEVPKFFVVEYQYNVFYEIGCKVSLDINYVIVHVNKLVFNT